MWAGRQLGPYDVHRLVGSGGQGTVWEAELRGPGTYQKQVALKVLAPDRAPGLRREHRLGGLLGHPNIVEVYDIGEAAGHTYLALEWVAGPSLEALVRQGPLPPRAVVDLGIALCDALVHAHGRGVVHRDVSPANVLLTPHGEPKLADLGLSVFVADPDAAPRAGTPGYAAPEQALGQAVDGRADAWSLGAVLYRAATGRHLVGRRVPVDLEELDRARAGLGNALAAFPPLAHVLAELTTPDPAQRLRVAEAGDRLRRLRSEGVPGRSLPQCVGSGASTPARDERRVGNVPPPVDAFFGREAERTLLARHLDSGGVVTVHGPGGMGKSRLTVQVTADTTPPGGAWLVELSTARRVEEVCAAVAAVLSVPLGRGDPVEILGHALAGRPPLVLVLDSVEQAVDPVSEVVRAWSSRAPSATLVVTSREVLGVPGERVVSLEALDPTAQEALFRARAEARGWEDRGSDDLPELLARVDGIPLAVELAAVQAAEVGISAALARSSSPDGETSGLHPAMAAALHGSWTLLDDDERAALTQLTVFEAGFTAEAADAVLHLTDSWSLDVLEALVDKALVFCRDAEDAGPRFGLYVPVRQFASTRLPPAERARAESSHGHHFAGLGAPELLRQADRGQQDSQLQLVRERANLTAALARAHARGDAQTAAAAALALWQGYAFTGPLTDGASALELTLELDDLEPATRGTLLRLAGSGRLKAGRLDDAHHHLIAALDHSDPTARPEEYGLLLGELGLLRQEQGLPDEAEAFYEQALQVSRRIGSRRLEGRVLGNLGTLRHLAGRWSEAHTHLQRALTLHRELGDRTFEGKLLTNIALMSLHQGDLEQGVAHSQAALQVSREVGNRRSEAIALGNLGAMYLELGRWTEAAEHLEAGLQVAREVGDRRHEGTVLGNLASLDDQRGHLAAAVARYESAMQVSREVGNRRSEGVALFNLGMVLWRMGDHEGALTRFTSAQTVAANLGYTTLEGAAHGGLARAALEASRPDTASDHLQRALPLLAGVPNERGKVLCLRVDVAVARGDMPAAHRALEEARRFATRPDFRPNTQLAAELARVQALVEDHTV